MCRDVWLKVWTICVCFLHTQGQTQSYTKEQFPNPQTNYTSCAREKPSFVCDPGDIITEAERVKMDGIIAEIQNMKNCTCTDCGSGSYRDTYINFAVAVVPNVNGSFRTDMNKFYATKEFAKYLQSAWAFRSSESCHNDVVLVIAIEQRQLYTVPGAVAKQEKIEVNCINEIFNSAKLAFVSQEYGEALIQMLEGFQKALNNEEFCLTSEVPIEVWVGIGVCSFILLCFWGMCCWLTWKYGVKGRGGTERGVMGRLMGTHPPPQNQGAHSPLGHTEIPQGQDPTGHGHDSQGQYQQLDLNSQKEQEFKQAGGVSI